MRRLAVYASIGLVGAAVVVLSGAIPLNASGGHWAITSWFLDLAKRRSVATHSLGIDVPPLDDPRRIQAGAARYEVGCRPCHGAPGWPAPALPAHMTPHPPDLRQQIARWKPAELFTIVRHGIKFTGMPAWPAPARDDEVWDVVAFLPMLATLDRASYARMAGGPPTAPATAAAPLADALARGRCDLCHGDDGRGREGADFPRLAGQKPEYLRRALDAYARGTRHGGTMGPIATGLDPAARRALADHFAALPAGAAAPAGPRAERGAVIAAQGIPARRVPRCAECHGPAPTKRHAAYPRLAGQFAPYLELQLRLFAEDRRGGSEYAHLMREFAGRLTDDERRDAAAYYASLPPGSPDTP
jgi:cytochrome c553